MTNLLSLFSPDLTNKNTECPIRFEFQINNEQLLVQYVPNRVQMTHTFANIICGLSEIQMTLGSLYFI